MARPCVAELRSHPADKEGLPSPTNETRKLTTSPTHHIKSAPVSSTTKPTATNRLYRPNGCCACPWDPTPIIPCCSDTNRIGSGSREYLQASLPSLRGALRDRARESKGYLTKSDNSPTIPDSPVPRTPSARAEAPTNARVSHRCMRHYTRRTACTIQTTP